ncbi:hypothetical protein CLV62_11918 [Dysgonomonas alginatilytica]|uniref:Uncharacterized protein n=1 Tax=Dysgonomonas alginatilytica TaxID=1605892 RepID=A0A2V3PN55_9BACT|nr:hypothetical protein [Dysgonomonas alginatilytica]PXV62478.1 hypothetical protein CLV62_11918 [Dysgonomonas alginatilytica]
MEELSILARLLSNDDLLINNATGYNENFEIRSILRLIGRRESLDTNFSFCQIETAVIAFYKQIKSMPKYQLYAEELRCLLEQQMSDNVILLLEALLKRMQTDFFINTDTVGIVIKNLR